MRAQLRTYAKPAARAAASDRALAALRFYVAWTHVQRRMRGPVLLPKQPERHNGGGGTVAYSSRSWTASILTRAAPIACSRTICAARCSTVTCCTLPRPTRGCPWATLRSPRASTRPSISAACTSCANGWRRTKSAAPKVRRQPHFYGGEALTVGPLLAVLALSLSAAALRGRWTAEGTFLGLWTDLRLFF